MTDMYLYVTAVQDDQCLSGAAAWGECVHVRGGCRLCGGGGGRGGVKGSWGVCSCWALV